MAVFTFLLAWGPGPVPGPYYDPDVLQQLLEVAQVVPC